LEKEKHIKITLAKMVQCWNEKNAKDFSELFLETGEWTDVVENVAKGRKEIEELHILPFGNFLKHATLSFQEVQIKFIRADVAAVVTKWTTTGDESIEGKKLPSRYGRMYLILTLEKNDWYINVGHNIDSTATYKQSADGNISVNMEHTED